MSPAPIDTAGSRASQSASSARPACRHCGAPLLDERMRQNGFCCAGCSYVYRLIHEQGLAGYYQIKDEITAPADAAVFQPRDFGWLETAQCEAEQSATAPATSGRPRDAARDSIAELALDVQGISCAGCVWLIERIFQQQPGARDIETNAQLGQMRLRWFRGEFSAADFARKLQSFGYLLGPAGEATAVPESRALVRRIGLCAAFAMNVMLFAFPAYFGMEPSFQYARLFGLLTLGFATLSFLVGGVYFVGRAARALREGALHIDLPIAIGILGAYFGSVYGWIAGEERFIYFDFVASFILLMLIGRWAQVAAVERNQRRLLSQQPKPARVRLADGGDTPPEQLRTGQGFFVGIGQTVPVESCFEAGEGSFSLASISGEAEPRIFRVGHRVPAGAVNVSPGEARLTARQNWNESLLAQLLRPSVRSGARHLLLERIVRGYLIGILAVAVFAGIGWWLFSHDAARTWAVITAVLVVSCPCAIGLAFPLADEIATVALRRRGVFVREVDLWPRLNLVRKLVFDKTGTLTLETPVLLNPEAIVALGVEARAALHALVRDNPHSVSQCLLENLLTVPPPPAAPSPPAAPVEIPPVEIRETVGHGICASALGHTWSLHRAAAARAEAAAPSPGAAPEDSYDTVFTRDEEVAARFRLADTVRPDAAAEISALRAAGFAIHILSGDRPEKVARLATELQLPSSHALGGLSPGDKATWIDAHDRSDTLMLGDGANDSLAFDRALCRGTPVIHRGVLEQKSDFYYLGRGIGGLRALFAVNSIRRRTQVAVMLFSIFYNLLAVGLAIAGHMNPLLAAILMPLNSLLTLLLVTTGMRRAFR